jgi:hypothetical protein
MRRLLLIAVFFALPWIYTSERTAVFGSPSMAIAADEAPSAPAAKPDAGKAPDVDVNVNRTERHVISFANPTVLAVAVGGAILIIALIAMASRGGGTTIVREK